MPGPILTTPTARKPPDGSGICVYLLPAGDIKYREWNHARGTDFCFYFYDRNRCKTNSTRAVLGHLPYAVPLTCSRSRARHVIQYSAPPAYDWCRELQAKQYHEGNGRADIESSHVGERKASAGREDTPTHQGFETPQPRAARSRWWTRNGESSKRRRREQWCRQRGGYGWGLVGPSSSSRSAREDGSSEDTR